MKVFVWYDRTASAFAHFMAGEVVASLIVVLCVFLLTRFTRRYSPLLNYGLWSLVLLRLMLPPDLASPISIGQVLPEFIATPHVKTETTPSDLNTNAPVIFENQMMDAHDPRLFENQGVEFNAYFQPRHMLFLAWIIGVSIFAIIYVIRQLTVLNIIHNAREIHIQKPRKLLDAWRQKLAIRKPVRLLSTNEFLSPFTRGLFRPVIVIPEQLLHEKTALLDAVIGHEMAHIRHWDHLWMRLQNLLQIVYFFHPAVWIASSQLNQLRERLCDITVLRAGAIPRKSYAESMLAILQLNLFGDSKSTVLPCFGSDKQKFAKRLRIIMNMKNQPARALVSSGFIFCFGALLLLPTSRFAMVELPIEPHSISGNNAPIAGDEETVIAFENPLREAGKISSHFGITQNPFTQKRAHHDGIDIKAKLNTEVYTAAAGKVIKAVREYEVNKGYGKYVVIQHAGDFQTCYTHLNEVEIEQGVEVRTGDLIGKVGTTGKSTGPHLHFEIRKGKAAMDPEHYVGFAPQMAKESHKINPIKIGDLAFVHPLKNAKVTSVFGPSIDPFNKKSRNHRGLDLATKSGTEIKAPANGTVLAVQENKNFGKYILVDHGNDLKSRYTHLEKIIVEQGQHVKQGDVIGLVGSTGRSTGPHLHLEFIYDGAYINPDCVIGE